MGRLAVAETAAMTLLTHAQLLTAQAQLLLSQAQSLLQQAMLPLAHGRRRRRRGGRGGRASASSSSSEPSSSLEPASPVEFCIATPYGSDAGSGDVGADSFQATSQLFCWGVSAVSTSGIDTHDAALDFVSEPMTCLTGSISASFRDFEVDLDDVSCMSAADDFNEVVIGEWLLDALDAEFPVCAVDDFC